VNGGRRGISYLVLVSQPSTASFFTGGILRVATREDADKTRRGNSLTTFVQLGDRDLTGIEQLAANNENFRGYVALRGCFSSGTLSSRSPTRRRWNITIRKEQPSREGHCRSCDILSFDFPLETDWQLLGPCHMLWRI
jgi:hypothetical protein